MLRIRDFSIARKLTWMNMLVSGAALLLACAAFVTYEAVTFRQVMVRNLSIRAQIVASNSASAILFNDPQAAEKTLLALRADPHTVFAGIYTPDGKPFAGYWREQGDHGRPLPALTAGQTEDVWFEHNQIHLATYIRVQGKPVGIVYIRLDLREMSERLDRYAAIVAVVLFTSLLAALLVSSIFRRAVAEPIVHLAATARKITRDKDYSLRAGKTGNHDELETMTEAFNEMLEGIQERDAALQEAHMELERRVEQRTSELQAANKELEAFTYSVSHDLRAPLRHIDGFSKLLVEDFGAQLPEEGRRFLTRIREGTQQMGQLVDDLLNLARVGRRELVLQVTGLNSLIEEVKRDLSADSTERRIEWRVGALPFVECDPALMKQVFTNLLSNAVKYTRPRQDAVIEVGTSNGQGRPAVFVRDNGVGFSMKYADKLFGVFQRLHRAEDFEGTGVGLATVQRIIQKHGGKVWAEAETDRGATFYFTLAGLEARQEKKLEV